MSARDLRQILRFGIVGVACNGALYLLFVLLIHAAVPPLWSAATCYGAGVCISYFFNRTWSFASSDAHGADLPKFLLANAVGLCSTMLVLNVLLGWLRPEFAQLVNIAVTAMINYATLLVLGFGGARAG
jgi:putative flippase GtrA